MDKIKKVCISIIVFLILFILVMFILNYFNIIKQTSETPLEISYTNNIIKDISEDNIIQNNIDFVEDSNIDVNEAVQEEQQIADIKNNEEKKTEQSNVKTQTVNVATNKTDTKVDKTENETTNNSNAQQNTTNNSNQNKGNPALANTRYTETNTEVIPEIINILNNEIAKNQDLKDYGSKASKGNKADAYANTSGFTYRFVKDIDKGKVKGNYTIFEERIKNNIGAFGTYWVYAEDEYVYDAKGISPHWSQTLVWIYVTF